MFDQKMCCSDLIIRQLGGGLNVSLCHVCIQLVAVGACWWFPSRVFAGVVEVVGEVAGLGEADFPARRQTGGC